MRGQGSPGWRLHPLSGKLKGYWATLPAGDQEDQFGDTLGKVAGFSLHVGVVTKARKKLR